MPHTCWRWRPWRLQLLLLQCSLPGFYLRLLLLQFALLLLQFQLLLLLRDQCLHAALSTPVLYVALWRYGARYCLTMQMQAGCVTSVVGLLQWDVCTQTASPSPCPCSSSVLVSAESSGYATRGLGGYARLGSIA